MSELRPHRDRTFPSREEEMSMVKECSERLRKKLEEKNAELKRQGEELRLTRERLKSFFSAATAGLCILDSNLRYVQLNETLAAINGLPVKAHLGKTIHEIIPQPAPVLEKIFRQVISTRKPALDIELSGELPGQPGVTRHWLASYFPLSDPGAAALGAIVVDITDRKLAEEKLRRAEQQFNAFMDYIPGFAWIKDVEGRYVYMSKSRARLTKAPRDWRGKTDRDIWPPEMAAQYKAAHQKVLATRTPLQSVEPYPLKDRQHYMLASKFPIF